MYHTIAVKVAETLLDKEWIVDDQFDWCVYVLEKRIISFTFILLLGFLSLATNKTLELVVFTISFLLIRRRIGGWHAKSPWLCQAIGTVVTLLVILVLHPFFSALPIKLTLVLALVTNLIILLVKPFYPINLNFSKDIRMANNRRKNVTIVWISLLQLLCSFFSVKKLLISSFTGILVSLVALCIEYFSNEERRLRNEKD